MSGYFLTFIVLIDCYFGVLFQIPTLSIVLCHLFYFFHTPHFKRIMNFLDVECKMGLFALLGICTFDPNKTQRLWVQQNFPRDWRIDRGKDVQ